MTATTRRAATSVSVPFTVVLTVVILGFYKRVNIFLNAGWLTASVLPVIPFQSRFAVRHTLHTPPPAAEPTWPEVGPGGLGPVSFLAKDWGGPHFILLRLVLTPTPTHRAHECSCPTQGEPAFKYSHCTTQVHFEERAWGKNPNKRGNNTQEVRFHIFSTLKFSPKPLQNITVYIPTFVAVLNFAVFWPPTPRKLQTSWKSKRILVESLLFGNHD